MNESTVTSKVIAIAVLGLAELAVFVGSGSPAVSAAASSVAPVAADSGVSLHDGADRSRVAIVPASPAQSVTAYDR